MAARDYKRWDTLCGTAAGRVAVPDAWQKQGSNGLRGSWAGSEVSKSSPASGAQGRGTCPHQRGSERRDEVDDTRSPTADRGGAVAAGPLGKRMQRVRSFFGGSFGGAGWVPSRRRCGGEVGVETPQFKKATTAQAISRAAGITGRLGWPVR